MRVHDDPFPDQIRALMAIRDALQRSAHFVETIFNPWNVAEKLSSPEAVKQLQAEQPQRLLDALEAIAKSEATHARRAMNAGASGIFLAIANAQPQILGRDDYATFSAPFDRMVLDAVKDAPLNVLHLHGDAVYLDAFYQGWPAAVINYSTHGTKVGIDAVRASYAGVIAGGIDETAYRTLDRRRCGPRPTRRGGRPARGSSSRRAARCQTTHSPTSCTSSIACSGADRSGGRGLTRCRRLTSSRGFTSWTERSSAPGPEAGTRMTFPVANVRGTETDHQALIREIKEELSIDLIPDAIGFVGTFEAQAHGKAEGVVVRMTCYQGPYVGEIRPAAEIEEVAWFCHRDKERSSPVDRIIFDWLRERNLIDA